MAQAALYRYRIALNPPLPAGRTLLNERCGLVVVLHDDQGRSGFGEIAPLPGFNPESLEQATVAALTALPLWLRGQTAPKLPASVQWGLDCAIANFSQPLSDQLPPTIPLLTGNPQQLRDQWRHWQGERPPLIKLKVGRQAPLQDQALLHELLAIAPVRLRLDANRSWNLAMAQAFWEGLDKQVKQAIDYLEEPLAEPRQLLTLHQRTGMPWALDESLSDLPLPLAKPPGLTALVAKPMVIGGEKNLAQLATLAERWQIPLILSSALESSLGLRHIARLAAQLTPLQPPGIATWQPFAADLLTPLASGRKVLQLEQMNRLWQS